jgi:transposase-like protein
MSYRVPTAEVVAIAISDVLREHGAITSQRLFAHFVREKLRCLDKEYAITEERVRKIAIQSGLVSLDVETRDTGIRVKVGRCPVCNSRLRKVRNETIYGGSVILGYRCTSCPYAMGTTRKVPVKYTFHDALPRIRCRTERKTAQRTL